MKRHIKDMRNGAAIRANQREVEDIMKNFLANYRALSAERAKYRRIRDEIASLPRAVAIDLGIFPQDAERLAYEAVWG